jgi:hypothetical protein
MTIEVTDADVGARGHRTGFRTGDGLDQAARGNRTSRRSRRAGPVTEAAFASSGPVLVPQLTGDVLRHKNPATVD